MLVIRLWSVPAAAVPAAAAAAGGPLTSRGRVRPNRGCCRFVWNLQGQYFSTGPGKSSSSSSVREVLALGEAKAKDEVEVKVSGWIKSLRKQKTAVFMDLEDGLSGDRLQVVAAAAAAPGVPAAAAADHEGLFHHAAVTVSGRVAVVQKRNGGSAVEVVASKVEGFNDGSKTTAEEYPFAPRKSYPDDFSRTFPELRAKLGTFGSLLRIRSTMSWHVHDFFRKNNFVQIHTPILTSGDCEGGGEVFSVVATVKDVGEAAVPDGQVEGQGGDDQPGSSYFGKPVFLTVSSQLHLEAMCNGIAKVYSFSPAFRAERGQTRRHLSEFWMAEAEMAFSHSLEQDVLPVVEGLAKDLLQSVLASPDLPTYVDSAHKNPYVKERPDLDMVQKAATSPYVVMGYSEAMTLLLKAHSKDRSRFRSQPRPGESLGREHELFLVEEVCGNVPVFVVDWPPESKPFYVRRSGKGSDSNALAVDLLFPKVGEVCGGSLREFRADLLVEAMDRCGVKDLDWYLNLRRTGGCAPTGGFGLGFDRLLQFSLGVNNIRDTLPFPRAPHHCRLFIGAAPGDVRQVNVSGLPLLLIPEEVALLRSLDDLKVILVESSPVKMVPNDAVQKLHRDFMLKSGAEYAKKSQEARKRKVLENAQVIVEGKRRKLGSDLISEEAIVLEELAKIDGEDENHQPALTFNEAPWGHAEPCPATEELPESYEQRSSMELLRTKTFEAVWKKGYFLTSGEKFGGDFLAYPGDPALFHAKFIILCLESPLSMVESAHKDLVAKCRLGTSVKKTVLFSYFVDEKNTVCFKSLERINNKAFSTD